MKFPVHDIAIGEKHKLLSSVYASCRRNKDGSVGYNRPTDIAIRSRKHDKSTAASDLEDFSSLLFSLTEFKDNCLEDGVLKPTLFVSVGGSPDKALEDAMSLEAWTKDHER